MDNITPNPINYDHGKIAIGYDGRWYGLEKEREYWYPLKNSPSQNNIKTIIKNMKKPSINQLIDHLTYYIDPADKKKYGDNAWGSVQYGTAYAFYLILRILDYYGYDPIKFLNLNISLGSPTSLYEVRNALLKRQINQTLNEYVDPIICYEIDHEGKISSCQRASQTTKNINVESLVKIEREKLSRDLLRLIDYDFSSLEKMFKYAKNKAWDLWTWVPFCFNALYPHSHIVNIPRSPGCGPILNQLVQSDNYLIGLQAYLLIKNGWLKDDSVFCCFDT